MKLELYSTDDLRNWLANVVTASKYDLYYTDTLYAIKNVSTEPRLHAVVRTATEDDVVELAETFDMTVTNAMSFDWEHNSTPASN